MILHNQILKELTFRTSRSSGSGGQNVNKVETRVEARLDVSTCTALSEGQKSTILTRLKNRMSTDGILSVSAATTRSQAQNKKLASQRMLDLLELALKRKKIRKKTGVPKSVKNKRMTTKKALSEKKARRAKPSDERLH